MAVRVMGASNEERPLVLCVDDNEQVGATVEAILGEEGYVVARLKEITEQALQHAIDRLEPDCVLLDSASTTGYDGSWKLAAWLHRRDPSIPVIMFSAHAQDSREAVKNASERAQDAGFASVLSKPFSIEAMLVAVASAVRTKADPAP